MTRALLVEDDDERAGWMTPKIKPFAAIERARNSREAIRKLVGASLQPFDVVFLDFDIDPTGGGGHKVVQWIATHRPRIRAVIVHSANPAGGQWMTQALKELGYPVLYASVLFSNAPEAWLRVLSALRTKCAA